ncbi:MAG: AMP-binding protein, partial [Pseudomonadota bacterium]
MSGEVAGALMSVDSGFQKSGKNSEGSKPLNPTPTRNAALPHLLKRFETLCDALDYAAQGETGFNFYNLRGELAESASYRQLRDEAVSLANRLAVRFDRGDRIAVVAETSVDFMRVFFACQYAGMIPAPMPLPVNLGGKEGYLVQIRLMIEGAGARAAVGPSTLTDFLRDATQSLNDVAIFDFDELKALPGNGKVAQRFAPDEACYIQYSSGSTSAPKGVI